MIWRVVHLMAEAEVDEGWRKAKCECGTVREPHGEPLWPEYWPCRKLVAKKRDPEMWQFCWQGKPTIGGGYWLAATPPNYYEQVKPADFNIYLLIDSSLGETKGSNRSALGVVGLGVDRNFYLLDLTRKVLDTDARTDEMFRLHRKWRPLGTALEEYGAQADHVYIKERMEAENYRFPLTILGRAGIWHNLSKPDRIRTLTPQAKAGRWWFPNPASPHTPTELAKTVRGLVDEEWNKYHGAVNCVDDGLDMLSRINDPGMNARWPMPRQMEDSRDYQSKGGPDAWMGM